MCSPARAFFLGTMALFFHFYAFPSVIALVPLVRRQSNFESQWAQALPGVIDGFEVETGGGNGEVVADANLVCCTLRESLIEKTSSVCEGGVSSLDQDFICLLSHFPLVDFPTLLPIYTCHLPIPSLYVLYGEVKRRSRTHSEFKI